MRMFRYKIEIETKIPTSVWAEINLKIIFDGVINPSPYFFFSESVTDWIWSYDSDVL